MLTVYKLEYPYLDFKLTKASLSLAVKTIELNYLSDSDGGFTDMDGMRQQWLAELAGMA